MPVADLRIKVEGAYLDALGVGYGNVQRIDRADGGCYELAFEIDATPRAPDPAIRRGALVELMCAGWPVWAGLLSEPDFPSGQLVATGMSRDAGRFPALTAGGGPTSVPNTAVDEAIARGWRATRPGNVGSSEMKTGDTTDSLNSIAALLDIRADSQGLRWGVDAQREVWMREDPTEPDWFMAPDVASLSVDDDRYVTHLIGRYKSGASAFGTVTIEDAAAAERWGTSYLVVKLHARGVLSAAQATSHLTNLRKKIRARPGWADPVEPAALELLDSGGQPAHPALVQGGQMVRMLGVIDEALGVASAIDFVIGEVTHDVGAETVQITPVDGASRSVADIIERRKERLTFQG